MAVGHGGQVLGSSATTAGVGRRCRRWWIWVSTGCGTWTGRCRCSRSGEGTFPPLRSLDAFPGNLPLQVSSFVGRERELARAVRGVGLVAGGDVDRGGRGGQDPPGVAGRRGGAAALYGTGRGWWSWPRCRDPARVAGAVAAVFGSVRAGGPERRRRAGRVLADQADAADPGQLRASPRRGRAIWSAIVERACAGVVVLATSREGLGIRRRADLAGAVAWRLPMSTPISRDRRRRRRWSLFVERAERVGRRFRAHRGERRGRWRGCAGAWTGCRWRSSWPRPGSGDDPGRAGARSGPPFETLAGGRRGAVQRHQTLARRDRLVLRPALR